VEPVRAFQNSFFRNKAKNIVAASRLLIEHHGGAVPPRHGALLELPVWPGKTGMWCWPMPFGINAGRHCRPVRQPEQRGLQA